jgi:tRNA A37 threonylcarbamoyladenosine dehydratase
MFDKPQTNGSLVHITAIFGFTLAGLVIEHCVQRAALPSVPVECLPQLSPPL